MTPFAIAKTASAVATKAFWLLTVRVTLTCLLFNVMALTKLLQQLLALQGSEVHVVDFKSYWQFFLPYRSVLLL